MKLMYWLLGLGTLAFSVFHIFRRANRAAERRLMSSIGRMIESVRAKHPSGSLKFDVTAHRDGEHFWVRVSATNPESGEPVHSADMPLSFDELTPGLQKSFLQGLESVAISVTEYGAR